jgi:hypothetical protein
VATRNQDTLDKLCERIRVNAGDVADACSALGLTTGWVRTWMRDDPKVMAALEDAIEAGAMVLESAMIRRAVDGVQEPIYYRDSLVGHKTRYSDPLLIKALESRLPDRYGKKMEVNNNINVRHLSDSELDSKINMLMDRLGMTALPAPIEGEFTDITDYDNAVTAYEDIEVDDLL